MFKIRPNIKTKLGIGFALLGVLIGVLGAASLLAVRDVNTQARAYHAASAATARAGHADQDVSGAADSAAGAQRAVSRSTSRAYVVILTGAVVALAATALTWLVLARLITRPLIEARGFVRRIARGDLEYRQNTLYHDEFGDMINAVESMRSRFAGVALDVRESSDTINASAVRIAQGNEQLSIRTQAQAASLQQTAASMEQMTATVKQNADHAGQAAELAEAMRTQAGQASGVVGRAVDSMQAIDASSHKITDIVSLIDDIAFQTNLLALNASVEAARAGEHGRGFAVVAAEVRKLASRSAAAAKDIKSLIADSADKVAGGSAEVARSRQTLDEIVASVNCVGDLIAHIAAASKEQSIGIEQVNVAVSQMDSTTQHNTVLVSESAAAGRSLEEQATTLRRQFAFFRLQADEAAADATRQQTRVPAVPNTAVAAPIRTPVAATARTSVKPLDENEEWAAF